MVVVSLETRKKMSDSQKGKVLSLETREKIRYANLGKIISKETGLKISAAKMGHITTEETKRKISEAKKGHIISDETRKKIGEKNKGKTRTQKQKERISTAHKGQMVTEETRKKMSKSKKLNNHWNWQGGKSFEPYCPKFNNEFKERVRKRQNYTCQLCGYVWQEGEHKLGVHHVKYNKAACCDDSPRYFVALCNRKGYACHSKTNHNREFYDEMFTNLILLEYDGVSYE